MLRLGRTALAIAGAIHAILFAQTNLIINGDFSNDTAGWATLGVYGDAQGTGRVTNGSYVITILKPGTDVWNIQFTQANIKLDSAAIYGFSFDAFASMGRTIEANVSMNGGAYTAYSGNGTVTLTTSVQRFGRLFAMHYHSDTSARIEFNCGKLTGNVTIDNVSLQKITAPTIKLLSPTGGEQLSKDVTFEITWISVGDLGKLKLECSTDNGSSWQTISDQIDNSGSYQWTVSGEYSPWCLVRLSSTSVPAVTDVTPAPFEIIPSAELIRNGYFIDSTADWNLGVYAGKASGAFTDGKYVLEIDTPGTMNWQVQLTQSGISLINGKTYVFSFVASASSPCTVNVNIGMSGGAYTSYFDTSKSNVALTTLPQNFSFEFPMTQASDTNTRVEFNCGLVKSTVYLDKVSLAMKTIAATGKRTQATLPKRQYGQPFMVAGLGHAVMTGPVSRAFSAPVALVNALGRRVGYVRLYAGPTSGLHTGKIFAPGVYMAVPEKQEGRR